LQEPNLGTTNHHVIRSISLIDFVFALSFGLDYISNVNPGL
jgi:hypothetical protein